MKSYTHAAGEQRLRLTPEGAAWMLDITLDELWEAVFVARNISCVRVGNKVFFTIDALIDWRDRRQLPVAPGRLVDHLSWFTDRNDPTVEVAECRIIVDCPYCGEKHEHGWRLDGSDHQMELKVPHHGRMTRLIRPVAKYHGAPHYRIQPSVDADHAYLPTARLTRPSRRARKGVQHVVNC